MTHSGPICSYKPVYGRFALWAALLVAGPACFNPGPKPPLDEGGDASTGDGQEPGAEDGGSTSGSSDGGAPSQAEACEAYCSLMGDVCDATLPQYSSELSCLAVCERMNLGTPEDVLGNTVGCRTHHGLLASESPDPHCMHAGPTGDGTCGAPCESFCSLALTTCTGELFPWLDAEDCIAECREWPEEPRYEANVPDDATYACHMKHLTLAALQPEVHCNHIGPDTPVCVAP
ncbi:MAG: hypothetical protein AAF799_39780 [Myxococcota bacterium]